MAKVQNSFGEVKIPWITGFDAAAVALQVLQEPRPKLGKTTYVSGVEFPSFDEVARIRSDVLGRPTHYVAIDDERWIEELGDNPLVSPDMAKHVVGVVRSLKARGPIVPLNDLVRDLTRRNPMDLREFLASQGKSREGDISHGPGGGHTRAFCRSH